MRTSRKSWLRTTYNCFCYACSLFNPSSIEFSLSSCIFRCSSFLSGLGGVDFFWKGFHGIPIFFTATKFSKSSSTTSPGFNAALGSTFSSSCFSGFPNGLFSGLVGSAFAVYPASSTSIVSNLLLRGVSMWLGLFLSTDEIVLKFLKSSTEG